MKAMQQKPWKGMGMNGWVARWYTRTRQNDMEDFRRAAGTVAARLRPGSRVLEVAPGPGFFAIELSKLGNFQITGLDISRTFVEIATRNARNAVVNVDFRWGNASAMPFADASFDFAYCSAAFKNFSEPVGALNEIHRVLYPAGEALVADLSKDASVEEIDEYVKRSGRNGLDAWMTRWTFRHVLLKRAYTRNDFVRMAKESSFGKADIRSCDLGLEVRLTKAAHSAEGVA
jgi:ubiquinone/menaquinone biosynthesis C-methylase UbiE